MADIVRLSDEIAEIRKNHGDKALARDRVVETFSLLLGRFFGDRYTFDADSFKVRRKNMEIRRGSDRTLSDGEKQHWHFATSSPRQICMCHPTMTMNEFILFLMIP